MKIEIRTAGHKHFRLCFPTCLLLNSLTAFFLARALKRRSGTKILSARQLRRIFRAVRKEKARLNGTWELASVTTHDDMHFSVVP